jgi:DNA processing protein
MAGSQEQFDQLRLIRSPNIGPVSYRHLMGRFGSAKAALEALPDLVRRGGGVSSLLADEASIARELQFVAKFGGRHIFIGDPEYPSLLSHLGNAPPVLSVKGDLGLLNRVAISIVGARNASAGAGY